MKPWVLVIEILLLCLLTSKYPIVHKESIEKPNQNTYLNINKDKVIARNSDIQNDFKDELPIAKLPEKEIKIEPNWIDIRVSFYTISKQCTGNLKGISASGKDLKTLSRGGDGINNNITYIATPSSVPFGTRMYIEGIGLCEVVDRGSAIKWKGNTMKVDVFVPNANDIALMGIGIINTRGYIIKENADLSIDN